jgi:hypothetical protein
MVTWVWRSKWKKRREFPWKSIWEFRRHLCRLISTFAVHVGRVRKHDRILQSEKAENPLLYTWLFSRSHQNLTPPLTSSYHTTHLHLSNDFRYQCLPSLLLSFDFEKMWNGDNFKSWAHKTRSESSGRDFFFFLTLYVISEFLTDLH